MRQSEEMQTTLVSFLPIPTLAISGLPAQKGDFSFTFLGTINMALTSSSHLQVHWEIFTFMTEHRIVELEKTSRNHSQPRICLQTGICLSCPPKMIMYFLLADHEVCSFVAAFYPDVAYPEQRPVYSWQNAPTLRLESLFKCVLYLNKHGRVTQFLPTNVLTSFFFFLPFVRFISKIIIIVLWPFVQFATLSRIFFLIREI